MPRIRPEECAALDVEWYAVDSQGNIAVFCSAGEGSLPEFVCEDAGRTDVLAEYFAGREITSGSVLLVHRPARAAQVAREFSGRGLYYFDADDGTGAEVCALRTYYTKQAYPQKPLRYGQLPEHIRQLLGRQVLQTVNFALADTILVKHAYHNT